MVRHQRHFLNCSACLNRDIPDLVRLWILRLLVPLNGHRELVKENHFLRDDLAYAIGLGHWIDPPDGEFDPHQVRLELRKLHQQAERRLTEAPPPDGLRNNSQRLAGLAGLSEIERRIMEFAVLIHTEELLDDTAELFGCFSSNKTFHALSVVLDLPVMEIRAALSGSGVLARSGLVRLEHDATSLRRKLDILSSNFAGLMLSEEDDPVLLLRDTVTMSAPPELKLTDYEHIAPSLRLLQPYLRQAVESRRKGVNILLHGAPGTGKSQLTRVLARELGCELFEIASANEDGNAVDGEQRLRAYRLAQSLFAQRAALILFDEVEDVFNDGNPLFGRKSTAQTRKAWVNRMLEENPAPAFWMSNSIQCLDPAFLRRFDMIVELPVPPRKQRERIVRGLCGDLLPEDSVSRLVAVESLAPAVIARAVDVARAIQAAIPEKEIPRAVEQLIGNTLEAQGHRPLKKSDPNRLPDFYDPAYLNASADLKAVAGGLARNQSGRLCLYGPPGTGKTAFGRWLADFLGVPLHVKRASDLLSMWVGGSEKNLARTFAEAEQDGAVLLLDEVDSFLRDRRGARQSWEVTQVNEMLTQMESFSGVFIASTNLMDGLDQAALRRFDLKVKFDYLRPQQARQLFVRHCAALEIDAAQEKIGGRLDKLNLLTPGDFAAVARQHRFRPIGSAALLLQALKEECAIKPEGQKGAMGFV